MIVVTFNITLLQITIIPLAKQYFTVMNGY